MASETTRELGDGEMGGQGDGETRGVIQFWILDFGFWIIHSTPSSPSPPSDSSQCPILNF